MRITIPYLRQRGACCSRPGERYSDAALSRLGPPDGLTPIQVCNLESVPVDDRLWLLLHEDFVASPELRLLACYWARGALDRESGRELDQRSCEAVATAERFVYGQATLEELAAARDAAWAVPGDVSWVAARDAAWAAAWAVPRDAAMESSWAAAWAVSWDAAARDAARADQLADVRRILSGEWTAKNYDSWRGGE